MIRDHLKPNATRALDAMSSKNLRDGLTAAVANRCVGSAAPQVMENQQYRDSHAIAEHYDQKGSLIGNFFFFRGTGDRRILSRLVPTLSHQLYQCVKATRRSIENVIKTDQHITTKSSTCQFQKLIIDPIRAIPSFAIPFLRAQKKLIIVIDALDECDDKLLMREFIKGVIRIFQENRRLPLQVIITSRVEVHIQEALETPGALSVVHLLSLSDFDARADIDRKSVV